MATTPSRPTRDPLAGDPAEAAIRGMVETIVRAPWPRPLAVILFGSRARGDHRPTSDADFLIVLPEGTNERRAGGAVDDLLTFAPLEVDIITATPTRLAAARGDYGSVLHYAQEQGVVLYRAAADEGAGPPTTGGDGPPATSGEAVAAVMAGVSA